MHRFLALLALLIVMTAPRAALADAGCVDLDGAARICPAKGVYNLSQGDAFWAGLGVADPDSGQIRGVGVEVADGCRFSAFSGRRPAAACRPGSLEAMATRWAKAFETSAPVSGSDRARRTLIGIAPAQIGGRSGQLARYRSDYSGTAYADIWEVLFITEVNGRHFLFKTMHLSDRPGFDTMTDSIGRAMAFMEFSDDRRK